MTSNANLRIAKAAGTVMAAFVLSNLVGLLRTVLISDAFGTEGVVDAFNAANTYPNLLFSLIAGGALASAFVPEFTGLLARQERAAAWKLASALINLVVILLTATSLVSMAFAPQIVGHILAPDFPPERQALTASLLRILLIAPSIFGISGLFMGILNAHQVFLWPALAPSMLWSGAILGVLFLTPSMGIYGLAWGTVLGAFLHLLVQVPAILRLPDRRFTFSLGLRDPAVGEVGRLILPRLLGVAVVQINFVVNTILASGQPVGSLAAIDYAWRIMTMPQVVIAQAIAIAALPTFSAQAARGEWGEMRTSLAATLRGLLLLALPATVGLIVLRIPLTSLLFERGAFDEHSTRMVAWALLWYTAGLVGHSVVEVVSRAFYALHDTRTPVLVGALAMSLNVIFSISFASLFRRGGWMPHGGLALANSLATALEMVGLLVLMRRRLAGLNGRAIVSALGQAALASAIMGGILAWWIQASGSRPVWQVGAVGVVWGALAYGAATMVLGVPEVRGLLARLRSLSVNAKSARRSGQ